MKNKMSSTEIEEFEKAKKLFIEELEDIEEGLISENLIEIISNNNTFDRSNWKNRFREKCIGDTYDYLEKKIKKIKKLKNI